MQIEVCFTLFIGSAIGAGNFYTTSEACEGEDAIDPSTLLQLRLEASASVDDFKKPTIQSIIQSASVRQQDRTYFSDCEQHQRHLIFQEYPVTSRVVVSLFAVVAIWLIYHVFNCFREEDGIKEEIEERHEEQLDENTYTMIVASLVRDSNRMSSGTVDVGLRSSRIIVSLTLALLTSLLQIAILICIKTYVTPMTVNNIRDVYDKYEIIMYGNSSNHTTLTVNGKHRGIDRYFVPERFGTLSDDVKSQVCQIPFSQVFFLEIVLFIWAISCVAQFKQCTESFLSLVVVTPTVESMHKALKADTNSDAHVIVGLTIGVKTFLVCLVYLPWMGATGFLLWLGSRWLLATNDYSELVLNSVALEFLIKLKELLYMAMISERNKRDLRNLRCSPPWKQEKASYLVFFNGIVWGYLSLLWVWFYIFYFQTVLPDYKWDIRAVCSSWLAGL